MQDAGFVRQAFARIAQRYVLANHVLSFGIDVLWRRKTGRLVAKLKGARDRKRATGVKVEGRKSYAEMDPDMVRLAKRLHRYPVNGKRRSLRDISRTLAQLGHVASSGKPFDAKSIARMVESKQPCGTAAFGLGPSRHGASGS